MSNSLPGIVVVGFANKTVDEARERLRGAFANSNLQIPSRRIILNLAPADLPKDGSSLDVAMATAILAAGRMIKAKPGEYEAFIGELGLDGTIRPVRGIIGKLLSGRKLGFTTFYVPRKNLPQAQIVPHIQLIPLDNLRQLYLHLTETEPLTPVDTANGSLPEAAAAEYATELHDIVGQAGAKRALTIAAAGGHNLLLSGPPGTGKSMLAKALPSILPPLTHEETLEVTHLHSLAGHAYENIITTRPFRAPHHSASHVAIVGGGSSVRPGEVSLSHRGVLFFDELPEFQRVTIEALRQPLEDRQITVSRAKETANFPANFIFIATANPCPCGYYGSDRLCECTAAAIQRYQRKLSGPLLDRIDLAVHVDAVEHRSLLASSGDASESRAARQHIAKARATQQHRFASNQKLNAAMTNRDIKSRTSLSAEAKTILDLASAKLGLSARSYMRVAKVARTIADLDNSETIKAPHITEALQYRQQT
jgi:magnesium chelatase family protein